jgi:hypothetical protein
MKEKYNIKINAGAKNNRKKYFILTYFAGCGPIILNIKQSPDFFMFQNQTKKQQNQK